MIPSEREFSDSYKLSSTTLRRALNDLVQENFLERKVGKGPFVRRKKVKRDLRKVLGFSKNMTEMGLTPHYQSAIPKSHHGQCLRTRTPGTRKRGKGGPA